MISDAKEFAAIVEHLVGKSFGRSLAADSIKLIFGTDRGPKGTHYIWIDPPWEFRDPHSRITGSDDYNENNFYEWSELFTPINENILSGWDVHGDESVVFRFASGHSLLIPHTKRGREHDIWYAHWYASCRVA